ncbi:helix-turn-helix transcriptional regulator [Brumimicrobium aurantiacum]|uniref:WYL domain-containing protein n=1 Tax=Brumimicrobium aurantiacum TaxID=1737063 RepID=A0A3E1F0E3_9FLAO|nr:WYL domain-containing protein [Brumimicrobium aurantiacum]RFC55274.1 WYL domain-containing protein [Brumimicrobium aurantiacum]
MPHIKNALIRYRIIDKALGNTYNPYPSKLDLRHACEMELYGDTNGKHISDSTIEKDLFAMRQEMDAPIKYSKAHKGYYYDNPDFTINEKPLSEDDLTSIQFALSTLSQFKETEMFQNFGFALNKIIDRVNVDSDARKSDADIDQMIQFEKSTAAKGNEFLQPLLSAIQHQYIAYFMYESFVTQVKKQRKVTPLLLKEYNNRWYLICFDSVKEKVITYALDRISDLEIIEQVGEKPSDFKADLFFRHSIGITASAEARPEKIIFSAGNIAAKYINSQPFHESQKIVLDTLEHTKFELFALISEELIRELLSYGGDIIVQEPNSLKDELVKRIKQMKTNYNI